MAGGASEDVLRALDELRRSERRFQTMLESAPSAVTVVDEDGTIVIVNRRTEEMFGYDRGELLGESVELLIPEHLQDEHAERRRAFLSDPSVRPMAAGRVLSGRRKDGSEFSLEIWLSPMADDGEELVMAVIREVTERLELEDRLRQSQKLEAVGHLAGAVAHDFNNLLTAILTSAELQLSDLAPDDPSRQEAAVIKEAAERAATLTRQLLAFGRKQVLRPEIINLNQVCDGMRGVLRRVVREDIRLAWSLANDLRLVEVDPTQIQQVILNLVVNAQDALPKGGRITLETANVDLDEEYVRRHADSRAGPHAMLAISDNGVGIDPTIREQIFEPFFTTKAKGRGTGLGLSTVYGIVKQTGGNVWVYSEVGEGTTFKIYLPQAEGSEVTATAEAEHVPVVRGSERILLVEDDPGVRTSVERVLVRLGYEVVAAETAFDGLSVCENDSEIDLLITDVVMPELSGPELADRVATLRPDMRCLFMSGYAGDAIVEHGMLEEGVWFLEKPFTPIALAAKVREVLDG